MIIDAFLACFGLYLLFVLPRVMIEISEAVDIVFPKKKKSKNK